MEKNFNLSFKKNDIEKLLLNLDQNPYSQKNKDFRFTLSLIYELVEEEFADTFDTKNPILRQTEVSLDNADNDVTIFITPPYSFDYYLKHLELKEAKDGKVPDSVFFLLDIDRNILVGAINIRHYLNDYLLKYAGHIGDGIRPSERNKGYATEMIKLALIECKKLNINKVLMVCDKDNIASAKTIIKNGAVLENEFADEKGKIQQRFWITLSE